MADVNRVGIVGIGNMGTALIAGLLKAGKVGKDELCASDVSAQRRHHVSETYGIRCFSDNKTVVANSDIIIVAVEPAHMKMVIEDIREAFTNQMLISIVAGTPIDSIERNLQNTVPIVRAMPNNPCLVGEGMIVLAPNQEVSEGNLKVVKELLSSVGKVIVLDERFFDAVTGLSGSGPAYIYLVIEGLVEGGVKSGLPEDTALTLAAQTVLGAGKMVLETGTHPSKLRETVVTPGGTTAEGLKELSRNDVKNSFSRAVEKAAQRSKELSNASGKPRTLQG
ncbi:pyrroline-5-carboxylate reductase [Candidatus Bathyarchaeota archaeon]|nr:pyrroline-5-carboxylate reductase [Candidatus Bathyarchaeota archaeon]